MNASQIKRKANEIKKDIFKGRVNGIQNEIGWPGIMARYNNASHEVQDVLAGLAGAIQTARVSGMIDIAIRRKMTVQEIAPILAELIEFGQDQDAIARYLNAREDRFSTIWNRK